MSSLDSLNANSVLTNINTNTQVFTFSSTGSNLSSVNTLLLRAYGSINEDILE